MPRVTVSYRRDDSSAAARAIYDRLRSRYGAESVFMDIDAVDLGEDYRKRIYQAISQTDCLLVLIGPRWLGPTEAGHNRINDANDPVRLEVERALEMGLRVVPVLLEHTPMPSPDDLPKSLSQLSYLNAGDISTGREFDNQMERITRFIDRVFEEANGRTSAAQVAQAPKAVQRTKAASTMPAFPARIVAISAAAAFVILAAIGSSWALLHIPPQHQVAATHAIATKKFTSAPPSSGPGALAISYVAGNVAVLRGDQGNPVAAVRNAPLLPGDALVTGKNSYAELHLGHGTRLFLDGDTQVRVVRAGDIGSEVQLAQGTAEMHVFKASNAQVDTQLAALVGKTPGVYALSVVGDPVVTVTALAGQATLETPSGEQTLSAVRTVEFSGSNAVASVMNEQKAPLSLTTGFASFASSRTSAIAPEFSEENAAAPVPQVAQAQQDAEQDAQVPSDQSAPAPPAEQIDGEEDLATYGKWATSDYGQAWVPNEPPQWTPYSNGQWVWEPYYGYTWVANEPWGWAPYHYGRWAFQPGVGWMWVPGGPAAWAPAQVAFVQYAGFVAWVPLGPGDPYAPWWGPSRNVVYVSNVNRYRNWHSPRAITQVSIQQFHQGNFHHVRQIAYANVHHPTVVDVTHFVPPTRANLVFSSVRVHAVASFPRQAPFVGHPVAVRRAPFAPVHAQPNHVANFGAIPQYHRAAAPHVANSMYHPVQAHPAISAFGPARVAPQARPQYAHAANQPVHSSFGPAHVSTQYGPSQQRATMYGPAQAQTYQRPAQARTYQRPAQAQTYQRPAQTQTYQRPAQAQTYQRPAQAQTYQRPAQAQTYQRPAQTQTYQRPAQTQTYQRPAQTQTYQRPAQTYERPRPVSTVRPRN